MSNLPSSRLATYSAQTAILAIDQGTSSSRALLLSPAGQVLALAQQEISSQCPAPGWVEQDPELIWRSVVHVCHQVMWHATQHQIQVQGVAITNQRETSLLWRRQDGVCVYPAIVWQDRRTEAYCQNLMQQWQQDPALALQMQQAIASTGLRLDPYFSATKLRWMLDHLETAAVPSSTAASDLCFGTVDSFLLWRLTGGKVHATDVTNASRTLLFDIHQLDWQPQLLAAFGIEKAMLPKVHANTHAFGEVDPALLALWHTEPDLSASEAPQRDEASKRDEALITAKAPLISASPAASQTALPRYWPLSMLAQHTPASPSQRPQPLAIVAMAGDQQAAAIGQGCISAGLSKCTYGTGAFWLTNTGRRALTPPAGLLSTVAYQIRPASAAVGTAPFASAAPCVSAMPFASATPASVEAEGSVITTYALEGAIFAAGVVLKWLRDQLGLLADVQQSAELARQQPELSGVYLVPAFSGLGAPWWQPQARATLVGMTLHTGPAQLVRAALESVVLQSRDLQQSIVAATASTNKAPVNTAADLTLASLRIDGGMAQNDWFCQQLANQLALEVWVPSSVETTALGVALLAGISCGWYRDLTEATAAVAAQCWQGGARYQPDRSEAAQERIAALYHGWLAAVAATIQVAQHATAAKP
jgi:glycerol kinase